MLTPPFGTSNRHIHNLEVDDSSDGKPREKLLSWVDNGEQKPAF
jgi:hypothetical protein